jgi:mRNA interferase RelE/StbE
MAYEFTFTPRFQKHFKGLTAQEKKQLKNKLELLAQNPFHPSLRTKRIQGTTDLFECSVNMDIRIILHLLLCNQSFAVADFFVFCLLFVSVDHELASILPYHHKPQT